MESRNVRIRHTNRFFCKPTSLTEIRKSIPCPDESDNLSTCRILWERRFLPKAEGAGRGRNARPRPCSDCSGFSKNSRHRIPTAPHRPRVIVWHNCARQNPRSLFRQILLRHRPCFYWSSACHRLAQPRPTEPRHSSTSAIRNLLSHHWCRHVFVVMSCHNCARQNPRSLFCRKTRPFTSARDFAVLPVSPILPVVLGAHDSLLPPPNNNSSR